MDTQAPEPLVQSCVDLQDFAFFPLDVVRLRDSTLAVESTGDEFRAAVLLWCAAWHQVPAASLPDSEAVLARYAGYGRTEMEAWRTVRANALRGFVRCSDGRLYHPLLAEKANDAWDGKLRLRHRRECERIKKAAQRAETQPIYPTFDEWKLHLASTGTDRWESTDVPAGTNNVSPVVSPGTYEGPPQGHDGDVPGESLPLKGQGIGTGDRGQGQGTGEGESKEKGSLRSPSSSAVPLTAAEKAAKAAERLSVVTADAIEAYNSLLAKPCRLQAASHVGIDRKRGLVKRSLKVASEICQDRYGSPRVTAQFWADYFAACRDSPHHSGQIEPGKGHEGWRPKFAYLIRPDVMADVFERAVGLAA